jgi:hypothetical protein
MHIYFHLRYVFQMLYSYQKLVLMLRRYRYLETDSLPAGQGITLLLRTLKVHYSLYTKYLTYPYLKPVELSQNPQIMFLKGQL